MSAPPTDPTDVLRRALVEIRTLKAKLAAAASTGRARAEPIAVVASPLPSPVVASPLPPLPMGRPAPETTLTSANSSAVGHPLTVVPAAPQPKRNQGQPANQDQRPPLRSRGVRERVWR